MLAHSSAIYAEVWQGRLLPACGTGRARITSFGVTPSGRIALVLICVAAGDDNSSPAAVPRIKDFVSACPTMLTREGLVMHLPECGRACSFAADLNERADVSTESAIRVRPPPPADRRHGDRIRLRPHATGRSRRRAALLPKCSIQSVEAWPDHVRGNARAPHRLEHGYPAPVRGITPRRGRFDFVRCPSRHRLMPEHYSYVITAVAATKRRPPRVARSK